MRALLNELARPLGLTGPLYRLYGIRRGLSPRLRWKNRAVRSRGAPDGLPIPPPHLIFVVAGTTHVEWFLRAGRNAVGTIFDVLEEAGRPLATLDRVLDFGCGCGRVLRHLLEPRGGGPALGGCDYNPRLTHWVGANLPGVTAAENRLDPPLPYGPGRFDLVYALSVLTHLNEERQELWAAELRRVRRAGGLLLLTVHGDRHAHELTPEELARGFEVVAFRPGGAASNPHQDVYLLRKE